jgi:hypothetical protein
VIAEVDEALCRALARVLPKGTAVRLDPPKPTWQTETPSQAVDLFLFGLAGDKRGASSGFEEVRDSRGAVLSRTDPPRRYLLSYLVTARAPEIAEEHGLLDTALRALTDGPALPDSCLPESLAELGMPVMVELDDAGPGALWSSLGMPARAAFVLSVSAPHRAAPDTDLAPPADKIDLRANPIWDDAPFESEVAAVASVPSDAEGGDAAAAAATTARSASANGNGTVATEKRWVRVRTSPAAEDRQAQSEPPPKAARKPAAKSADAK